MQIVALVRLRLGFLYGQWMGFGQGVMANACYLPAHFHAGLAAGDLEAIVLDFLDNVEIGRRPAERRELISEVLIEGLKPGWKLDHSLPPFVQNHHAVVEVLHVGRLDKRVAEILPGRIKRVINLEASASLVDVTVYRGPSCYRNFVSDEYRAPERPRL